MRVWRLQNEVYFRKRLWKDRRTLRKVRKYLTPQPLLDQGVQIHDALDIAANEFVPEPFELPEPYGTPYEKCNDSRNPNWHDQVAYIVHKKSRLLEGDKHMCLLTKTVRYDSLPVALSEHVRRHALGEAHQKAAREALAQVHLYDSTQVKLPKNIDLNKPHWTFPREYGVPIKRKVSHILASFHHLCEKLTSHVPEAMDRTRLSDVVSNACFQKEDGNTLVFKTEVDTLMTSKVPLGAFNTPEEVKATADVVLPDLYPAKYTLDLDKDHIYLMDDVYPVPRVTLNQHPHTLHVTHPHHYFWFPKEKLARAILACFTFAAARARQLYGADTLTLPEPVALQCTYSDAETFGFLAYQLNTLDLSTDEGIKNQVWVEGEPHKLFESCNHREGVVGHNPAVFQNFLAFYTSGFSQLPSLKVPPGPTWPQQHPGEHGP
ncbi:large ribosomal subunit protein mL37 isoform X4 [Dermacentor albipictus]|uniref:large ribosomal subunit protein mL37 isoform X4 n=1 Tax=Dermacentor albipictus TaxID=60249 RepID=UPI0031FDBE17